MMKRKPRDKSKDVVFRVWMQARTRSWPYGRSVKLEAAVCPIANPT